MAPPTPPSKAAPPAAADGWTIAAAPAGAAAPPTAADADALLRFFSTHRRSTVGEVAPPQVPYGVAPASSTSFWAIGTLTLDLELSPAEVSSTMGSRGWAQLPVPAGWLAALMHTARSAWCVPRPGAAAAHPPFPALMSPRLPPPAASPQAQWLVSPPPMAEPTAAALQLAPARAHPLSPRALRTRAATAATATKAKLRAVQRRVAASPAGACWQQLATAASASPLLSARIH